ncbi:MAG: hypothetical protein NTV87_01175 [Ignavibacteriae bacterium]|nr:hypothetical protein [Ignavibacteriota bacterium]
MKKLFIFAIAICFSISCFTLNASAQQNDLKLSLTDKQENHSGQFLNKYTDLKSSTPGSKVVKEKDFTFSVNPYLWTVATGGFVGLPNTQQYDFNRKFTDAVGNLKMMVMVSGRFKYKPISLLYDVFYIKLNPSLTIPVTDAGRYISGSGWINEFVGDFSLAYRVPIDDKTVQLDLYGGARVWSLDNTIDLISTAGLTTSNSKTESWVDPVIGAGVNFDFQKKWFTYLKGDIGGFGVSSKFTSVFIWGIGYRFDDHWNTSFGLKNMYIDYNKNSFVWNVWQYGLLLSVGYKL